MKHRIENDLKYYYDFSSKFANTHKVHIHTYVDDKIVNLFFYTNDDKLVESLDYLKSKGSVTMDLDVTKLVNEFEYVYKLRG